MTGFGILVFFKNLHLTDFQVILGLISSFLNNIVFREVLDEKSYKNIQLILEFLRSISGLTFFLLYNNDLPDDVIYNIAICTDDTTMFLIMLSVVLLSVLIILLRHLICDNNYNWLLSLNLVNKTMWTVARTGWFISVLKKLNRFRLTCLITLKLLM